MSVSLQMIKSRRVLLTKTDRLQPLSQRLQDVEYKTLPAIQSQIEEIKTNIKQVDEDNQAKEETIDAVFEEFKEEVHKAVQESNRAIQTLAGKTESISHTLRELEDRPAGAATSADSDANLRNVVERSDALSFAVNDLERRFDNLQTDELLQKMIHQMRTFYPAPANIQRTFDDVGSSHLQCLFVCMYQ